jgi:Zn-finger nucleic acid-binding protein
MILLACPACSRQYDVTHLAPGELVRCSCEERIGVPWHRPVAIGHLQCRHCGGQVARENEECPWCGQGLPEAQRRASALCPMCFARIDEDSRHCRACGSAIRPQAVNPIPDGRACPRCHGELAIRMLERDEVIECSRCGGAWFEARSFERICAEARRPSTSRTGLRPPPRGAVPVDEPVRYIPCLSCGELMLRRQYRQDDRTSGVIVDQCRDHGIWLDPLELERILDFLQALEAGPRSPAGSAPRPARQRASTGSRQPAAKGVGAKLESAIGFLGSLLFDELF